MNSIEDDESFIERCPHDEENPYTQILNALIRDASITPDCRWLLIYLLSNAKNWKISVQQLINHLKPHRGYERKSIYKLINEAIEAGYMKREQENKGKFGKVKYFLSEKPKFKKCLPQSTFPLALKRIHKKQHVVSSRPKAEEETQQQQEQPVVVASLPAEAGEANFWETPSQASLVSEHEPTGRSRYGNFPIDETVRKAAGKDSAVAQDNLGWDLPIDEIAELMTHYGIDYVDAQLNYMMKYARKIKSPMEYLGNSCKKNYARAKKIENR